jgi:hypothetical protein
MHQSENTEDVIDLETNCIYLYAHECLLKLQKKAANKVLVHDHHTVVVIFTYLNPNPLFFVREAQC